MSYATRAYEEAIKMGDLKYQWAILSTQIRMLQERQRTIKRAEQRAKAQGIDHVITDIAIGAEFAQNKEIIQRLQEIRQQTRKAVSAQKKGQQIPKIQTYKALTTFRRMSARKEKEVASFRPSERTLSAKIQRSANQAIEELIERMFFGGKMFEQDKYSKLEMLSKKYKWVFDFLGFTLSDLFRSDVAKNYGDYASDTAYEFFATVIDEDLHGHSQSSLTDVKGKYVKDGVDYIDDKYEHTVEEYRQAINEIVAEFKS